MALLFLKTLLIQKEIEREGNSAEANETRNHDTSEELEATTCRVCNGVGQVNIFVRYQHRNLAEDIRQCSGVPVYINDGFHQWLCSSCLQLLQYAVKFREMCRRSTARLMMMKPDAIIEESPYTPTEYEPTDHYSEGYAANSSPEMETQFNTAVLKTCQLCKEHFHDMRRYREHLRACRETARARSKELGVERRALNGTKDKEHLCETCGKALSSIHSLISHRTIHQNVFPYKCDLCPYRGKTAGLLRTHRKIHFSEKPYRCAQCPGAFRTSSNLKKHMYTHKGLKEPVQCAMCDKTLRNKETLRGHINSVHVNRPPVSCSVCGKQFKAARALYKHRSKVHNWRAEFTGRLPAYMLCQPDDTDPTSHHISHENIVVAEP